MLESVGQVFILIGTDFQEQAVVDCLCYFRQAGIRAQLVGLLARPLSGFNGVCIKPDLSLTQMEQKRLAKSRQQYALIIASSQSIATSFMTDPRLDKLVHESIQTNNLVALLEPLSDMVSVLATSELQPGHHFLLQESDSVADFSQQIVDRLYQL